jgi:hypothetical protein
VGPNPYVLVFATLELFADGPCSIGSTGGRDRAQNIKATDRTPALPNSKRFVTAVLDRPPLSLPCIGKFQVTCS